MLVELWLELEIFFSRSNSAANSSSLLLTCVRHIRNSANKNLFLMFATMFEQYAKSHLQRGLDDAPNFFEGARNRKSFTIF